MANNNGYDKNDATKIKNLDEMRNKMYDAEKLIEELHGLI